MRKHAGWLLAAGVMLGTSAWLVPQASAATYSGNQQQLQASWWPQEASWDWTDSGNDSGGEWSPDQNAGAGENENNGNTGDETGNSNDTSSPEIEKIIAMGMDYSGTPYEFGSDRDTDRTFDCSDFMKWIFEKSAGVTLPSNSRTQGDFVKERGHALSDWHKLKRGDLMFFMSYKGSDASDYRNIDRSTARITHVGIYLGDGKILHTFSKESGGVQTTSFAGTSWEHRFLFGGSAL